MKELITKYDVPAPRYTSYPTVPYWDEIPTENRWKQIAGKRLAANEGTALYIHLPYCESLCTYCACNTRITVNHAAEAPYIRSILSEWKIYRALAPAKIKIAQLHLGGGTPTFFSPENLVRLCSEILKDCQLLPEADLSFEGHPNNTTKEHLDALYALGFRRVSFGIQDFDEEVQRLIHRIQPIEKVQEAVQNARSTGYKSVNFDLVYGLPGQTPETIGNTISEVIRLLPDRIALYSYAHVPWLKPAQRSFDPSRIPAGDNKMELYRNSKAALIQAGYVETGLDHFALPGDTLSVASRTGHLHRNFMGYTTVRSKLTIGLGASAISDAWGAFAQNAKNVEIYRASVQEGKLPIVKGHVLTDRDETLRTQMLNLMCRKETILDNQSASDAAISGRLRALGADGLIQYYGNQVRVTGAGEPFLRNICMALDERYWNRTVKATHSQSI